MILVLAVSFLASLHALDATAKPGSPPGLALGAILWFVLNLCVFFGIMPPS